MSTQPRPIRPEAEPLRLAVYGDPGVGKTTLAVSFPRPLVIDYDGGLVSVAGTGVEGLSVVPSNVSELEAVTRWIKAHRSEVDTVVIDGIDVLVESILHELTNEHRRAGSGSRPLLQGMIPEQVEYLAARNAVRIILAESRSWGTHVVLTSGVRELEMSPMKHQRAPDVPPSVAKLIARWSSVLGELVAGVEHESLGPGKHRLLVLEPSAERQAKTRYRSLAPYVVDPTGDKILSAIETQKGGESK